MNLNMNNLTPQRVDAQGRIYSTLPNGRTVVYHSDPEEAERFFTASRALASGRNELWLLIHAHITADGAVLRAEDGRTESELKADWLRKVTAAGMPTEAAEQWLTERIALED